MNDFNHVTNVDNADQSAFVVNHHGRHPAVFAEHVSHFFLVGINVYRHDFAVHDAVKLFVPLGAQKLVEGNFTGRFQGLFVNEKNGVKIVRQLFVIQKILSGFPHRPVVGNADKIPRHDTAGGIFRIVQRRFHLIFQFRIEPADNMLLLLVVHVFEDFDRVVGIEFVNDFDDLVFV